MNKEIVLIDLSGLAHMLWHVSSSEPDPDATSRKVVERVRAIASGQPHVGIALDMGRSFRHDVDPTYKANRPEHLATLQHQIDVTVDVLKQDGFPCWGVKGFEGDDVIASVTASVLARDSDTIVLVCSSDKDMTALVSDRVRVKSFTNGNIYDVDAVTAKFGVPPHAMTDWLCLVGDASDGVKGAEGIGPKKAAKLLAEFGNLDDLYRALDETPSKFANGTIVSLREFQPRMPTVRELITLRTDVPLPFEEIFRERVPADVAVFGEEEAEMGYESRSPDGDGPHGQAQHAESVGAAPPLSTERVSFTLPERQATAKLAAAGSEPADSHQMAPPAAQGASRAPNGHPPSSQPAPVPARALEPEVLPPPSLDPKWQLEPRSMAQAKQVAADLFASRMFSAYGNAPAVLSTIMAGRELGFQTMAALRAIHIIDGKPALSAGAIHSLVLTSGKAKYFRCVERTAERATFETQRGDDPPMSLSFTIDEGRQAWNGKRNPDGTPDEKSWAASGWGRNPADMLVARALTKLARLVYPDITHGLYAPEELS
jgi:5'-3' exonuclease